jgi:hypothetical protein
MRELGTGYGEAVVACWTCFGGGFGNNVRATVETPRSTQLRSWISTA